MTKQAVAIVRIEPGTVRSALASAGEDALRIGANGEAFRIEPLEDATLVHLGVGIDSEPAELGARTRVLLGPLLDAHTEARGVPVYPSSYTLEARSWDAAVEELGEAADWVKVDPGDAMAGMLNAFGIDQSALAGVDGDVFSSALLAAQQMAESGALDGLAEQMRAMSPEGGFDLEALQKQAQQMLAENPDLEAQIREAFEGADGDDDE